MPANRCYNVGSIASVIALTLAALAFATDRWLTFKVDRSKLTGASPDFNGSSVIDAKLSGVYYERDRGLLQECYGDKPGFLDASDLKRSSRCAWLDYDIPPSSNVSRSDAFNQRIHFFRATPILLLLGVLLLFVAFWLHIAVGCCDCPRTSMLGAGLFSLAAFFCLVASMACFFVAFLHYEMKEVKDNWHFWAAWPKVLQDNTSWELGWSFYVFVVSLPVSAAASAMFLVGYCTAAPPEPEAKPGFDDFSMGAYPKQQGNGSTRPGDGYGDDANTISDINSRKVINQRVYRETVDPATGRQMTAQLNRGYESDESGDRPRSRGGPRDPAYDNHRGHSRRASHDRDEDRRGARGVGARQDHYDSDATGRSYPSRPDRYDDRANKRGGRDQYDRRDGDKYDKRDRDQYDRRDQYEPRRDYDSPRGRPGDHRGNGYPGNGYREHEYFE